MDEHCKLQSGEIFQDFDCLLNFAGKKSDRFYRIQVLKNHKGFHVWTRWGRNVSGIFRNFDTFYSYKYNAGKCAPFHLKLYMHPRY
jgi:hypothetical protein